MNRRFDPYLNEYVEFAQAAKAFAQTTPEATSLVAQGALLYSYIIGDARPDYIFNFILTDDELDRIPVGFNLDDAAKEIGRRIRIVNKKYRREVERAYAEEEV